MSKIDEYRNQIIVGDSLELLRTLPDESVPMFFFSPPYNMGISSGGGVKGRGESSSWRPALQNDLKDGYSHFNDAMEWEAYTQWQKSVLVECWRLLLPNGAIYYQHKPRVQNGEVILPMRYGQGLPLRQIIIWDRGGGINYNRSFYTPVHEYICVWAKPGFRLIDKTASAKGDVWRIPFETNSWHPAPFPIKLATMALETVMPSLVVDPFMGSGTTAKAAVKLGIDYIGFELSPTYAERARKEIAEIEAQPRLIPLEATQEKMVII